MASMHTPSLEELGDVIRTRGITTLWLTAGLFHQMVESQAESLRGVRQLLAGGDALSAAHVREALRQLPGCRVINGYGPNWTHAVGQFAIYANWPLVCTHDAGYTCNHIQFFVR